VTFEPRPETPPPVPTTAPAVEGATAPEVAVRRPRVFYGWWVVAAVFVMLTISSGLGFYNLTVFLRALSSEQGFSVSVASGATAVFFGVVGVAGLPLAALLSRHDPRLTIAAGALVSGASLALLGRVTEVWQLYVVYCLFGLGFAASSLLPGTTLVTSWFARRRSTALSVATTGLSLGGVLITPLCAALIEDHGLEAVTPWLGVAYVLGVLPITALLVRSRPAARGLQPDGDPAAADTGPREADGLLRAEALRTREFRVVTLVHLLAMVAQVGALAHVLNLVAGRLDAGQAAAAVSVIAVSSMLGRLAGGVVLLHVGTRPFAAGMLVVQGVALLVLGLGDRAEVLLPAAALFGATVGNVLLAHPLLLSQAFGVRDYARIFSTSNLIATLGIASGPAVLGILYDGTGGYAVPFGLAFAASVAAAALLLATRGDAARLAAAEASTSSPEVTA
jgi:predicted MFS family arabinose efflux permease